MAKFRVTSVIAAAALATGMALGASGAQAYVAMNGLTTNIVGMNGLTTNMVAAWKHKASLATQWPRSRSSSTTSASRA